MTNQDCGHCSIFYKKGSNVPSISYHQPNTHNYTLDYERAVIKDLQFNGTTVTIIDQDVSVVWWFQLVFVAAMVALIAILIYKIYKKRISAMKKTAR